MLRRPTMQNDVVFDVGTIQNTFVSFIPCHAPNDNNPIEQVGSISLPNHKISVIRLRHLSFDRRKQCPMPNDISDTYLEFKMK